MKNMTTSISLMLGLGAFLMACGGDPSSASTDESTAPLPSPRVEELATTHTPAAPTEATEVEPIQVYAPQLEEGAVRLRRLIVATGIEEREPSGAADVFARNADRVYAFIEAVNETDQPAELRVTFEPERGESVGHVTLEVPARARRFRTWAYSRNVQTAGEWQVVVRAADRVIARRPFTVE